MIVKGEDNFAIRGAAEALEPTNRPYAVAKIAGLEMVDAYARQYGFRGVSVMPTKSTAVPPRKTTSAAVAAQGESVAAARAITNMLAMNTITALYTQRTEF